MPSKIRFGSTRLRSPGGCEGRCHKSLCNPLRIAAAASDQISKSLHNHAASQHIGQPCDTLAVSVAVLEGFGKMLGHQKGKIGIFCPKLRTVIAVSIHRHDSIGILVNHHAVRIHTEGSHIILKTLRPVHNLALIEFIRKMGKDYCRQLHTHTDIHPVGSGGNRKLTAYLLHPFAATASYGYNTLMTFIGFVLCQDAVALLSHLNFFHRRVKEEIHMFLHLIVKISKNNIIHVCPKMSHQKLKFILQAEFLQGSPGRGIHLCSLTSVGHIDAIHIFHEFKGTFSPDIFIEGSTEIIRDIVFSIGKGTRAPKSVHNGAGPAFDTALDLVPINRAVPLLKGMPCIKNSDLKIASLFHQFIGRKDASRPCPNDNHIIHSIFLPNIESAHPAIAGWVDHLLVLAILVAVLQRSLVEALFEGAGKMLHILVSHSIGNILNSHIPVLQKRLRPLHTDVSHMFPKGLTGFILNILGNIRLRQMELIRHAL